jgi:hypothetical protein
MRHIVPIFSNNNCYEGEIECPDTYKCGDYEIEFSPIQTCPPGTVPESIGEYKIVYGMTINVTSTKSREQILQEVKEKYGNVINNDKPYVEMRDMWDNTKIREVEISKVDYTERCPACGEAIDNDW